MQQPPRRIAHLDMDAFYASVDLLRYPELRGLPVVIGGRRSQQPVVMADGSRRFARLRDYARCASHPAKLSSWPCGTISEVPWFLFPLKVLPFTYD